MINRTFKKCYLPVTLIWTRCYVFIICAYVMRVSNSMLHCGKPWDNFFQKIHRVIKEKCLILIWFLFEWHFKIGPFFVFTLANFDGCAICSERVIQKSLLRIHILRTFFYKRPGILNFISKLSRGILLIMNGIFNIFLILGKRYA